MKLEDRFYAAVGCVMLVCLLATPFVTYGTVGYRDIVVAKTERTTKLALVWTADEKVYKVENDLLQGKFSSAETYGQIERGGHYRVKTNWFRAPLIGQYPNILEVEQVSK
jgi:hypothetical protein